MSKRALKAMVAMIFAMAFFQSAMAQDTLPNFTVEDKGEGRIVVSWSNPYTNLIQLAVQRSPDSLKRFSSVYAATSPELPLNGFSDKVIPGVRYFYRIFYVMQGGSYYFSKSKKPTVVVEKKRSYDSRRDMLDETIVKRIETATTPTVKADVSAQVIVVKPIFVKTASSVLSLMPFEFKAFRDSILSVTNDTLVQVSPDTIAIEPYSPPYLQRSSQFVFTDRDGFIVVKIPENNKKYELVFMEEDDTPVLEFKSFKKNEFTIDKTNFYHGGWYKFEIRENGRIKERNKVFLPTDF